MEKRGVKEVSSIVTTQEKMLVIFALSRQKD
jgi:hypothetical protein